MDKEVWKDVKGYEDYYELSNKGVVRVKANEFSRKERILKGLKTNRGYFRVALYKNGKAKFVSIHRLVAIHFITNPENKAEVKHKDGDKTNNNHWNLEWNTHKENIKHSVENGLVLSKENHSRTNLTIQDVEDIRNSNLKVSQLCKIYNLHNTTIYSILKRETWN